MGSDGVVAVAPLFDEDLGFLEAAEDFAIEQLVPRLAVEAFAIAVFPGAARFDVERLGSNIRQPLRTILAVISGPLSDRMCSGIRR